MDVRLSKDKEPRVTSTKKTQSFLRDTRRRIIKEFY